jgi:predicted double-glycine peptidase
MVFNWLAIPAVLLACALFPFGRMLAAETETRNDDIMFAVEGLFFALPAIGFLTYHLHFFDGWERFYTIRAVTGTEILAGMAGLLCGMLAQWTKEYRFLGVPGVAVLMVVGILTPHLAPVFQRMDLRGFKNEWQENVCHQSHPYTSGPAAVATLLRKFGNETTEEKVARKTLTSRKGTEPWYLSRYLEKHGLLTEFHLQEPSRGIIVPSLAQVILPDRTHYLAILGNNTNGQFLVGDPNLGALVLGKEALTNNYRFSGLFLEVKPRK